MKKSIILVLVLFLAIFTINAQNKTALVIGNGDYQYFSSLNQPRTEASQMSAALNRLGFEVILLLDASEDQMMDALVDFEDKLKSRGMGQNYPVNQVSWNDAIAFCNKLSEKEGLEPVYSISGSNVTCDWTKNGYRLPTEAEWEFAAKGGTSTKGYTFSGGNSLNNISWYWQNSGDRILSGEWDFDQLNDNNDQSHPLGEKIPSELGLYDMSVNVSEWCWDFYGQYESNPLQDPRGASFGSIRVL